MTREPDFVDECYVGKDLSLLKKLTLVIPTYNRNYYLSRCLWYHAHFPFGEIIVADSSPEEKKVVNRETVSKVHEMFGANIKYLEYEPETEKYGGDIYRKWGDAVQHVETEYTQICTDKEFLIPSTLQSSIQYLDGHSDYIASLHKKYYINNYHSNNTDEIHKSLSPRHPLQTEEISEDPIQRFLHSINVPSGNNSLLLSLIRSKHQKYLYNLLTEYNINDIRYSEITIGYTGYLLGKAHYDQTMVHKLRDNEKYLMELKQQTFTSSLLKSSESSCSRYPDMSDYKQSIETLHFQKAYHTCIESLIRVTPSVNSINIIMNEIFSAPIYKNKSSKRIIYIISKLGLKVIQTQIWNKIPLIIKKYIRIIALHIGLDFTVYNNNYTIPQIDKIKVILMICHNFDKELYSIK